LPSLQTRFHGPVPVSAAEIVVEVPAQIDALPLTEAVGFAVTVIVAPPVPALLQLVASDTELTV